LVLVVSFVLFALALAGCAFEDEGRVPLEGGQCATQFGTISVVPKNMEEPSWYRIDDACTDSQVLEGSCPEPWTLIDKKIIFGGVCFSDDHHAIVSMMLPQGVTIEAEDPVLVEFYSFYSDPEIAFEEGSTQSKRGTTFEDSGPVILRIRTLPREE
jgi:hypothetical protein